MKVSLHGLLSNVESALRSSQDDYACMHAYCLMELGDNLRKVANGEATAEEFFALYVVDKNDKSSWAETVDKRRYDCMQEDEPDVDADVHYSSN
jgi:hypothetical protein